MANQEHFDLLKQSIENWNRWRKKHPEIKPDLSKATLTGAHLNYTDLSEATLTGADLRAATLTGAYLNSTDLTGADLRAATLSYADLTEANLREADLSKANLIRANLREATLNAATFTEANLREADLSKAILRAANLRAADLSKSDLRAAILTEATLSRADLSRADLTGATLSRADLTEAILTEAILTEAILTEAILTEAILTEADLSRADLSRADLTGATLSRADLSRATIVGTNFTKAILTDCRIYGISAWDIELTGATQSSLVITDKDQPTITVDNLKIAQFIYLLLNNQEIRDVINTITTKVVLLLGRFTPERKAVLDRIKEKLHTQDYVPVLFDFDQPSSRDITETVTTLAHMARFIIADITDAKSIPQELAFIVPNLPSVPVQPILLSSQNEYSMFEHFTRFSSVLPIYRYPDLPGLLTSLKEQVIEPAEKKAQELEKH